MPKITQITIRRLFNLGSYEHISYDLKVEVGDKESAAKTLTNLEKILNGLAPLKDKVQPYEIEREDRRVAEMLSERNKIGDVEFKQKHGFFEGTPLEYIARCAKNVEEIKARRSNYEQRLKQSHAMLDDIGGEAKWKDAKLDWEICD